MYTKLTSICSIVALSSITACSSSIDGGSNGMVSSFVTPTSDGEINREMTNWTKNYISDSDNDGYAYKVGVDTDNNYRAVAGIVQNSTLTTLPSTGTAGFTGGYRFFTIDRLTKNSTYGYTKSTSGTLNMDINLATGAVVAESEETTLIGNENRLRIVGTLTGQTFQGTMTVRDYLGSDEEITGVAKGAIGTEKAIGAFHGTNGEDAVSGGFLLTPK